MGRAQHILRTLVNAGGAAPREAFGPWSPAMSTRMGELKARGLVEVEFRITDEGRDYLMTLPALAPAQGPAPKVRYCRGDLGWRHPLASTEKQIEDLKKKACEDRSFGFESINQRGHDARK